MSRSHPIKDIENPPQLKLYYFNIKGKGEPIRLLSAYSGLALEDIRFADYQEFLKLRESGQLAFGQVPLLEVTSVTKNGSDDKTKTSTTQLVQTAAILRYLCTLTGLHPTDNPLLAAKIDAILDQETDAFAGVTAAYYYKRYGMTPLEDETLRQKVFDNLSSVVLPRHLGNIEKLLQASTTGWLAGTEHPTAADFVWFSRLADYVPNTAELSEGIRSLEDYPACRAFCDKFRTLEAIQAYYNKSNKKQKREESS